MTEIEPLLRKFQKELSSGTVSLALLAVMAAAREPLYGYQVAKQLEAIGEGVLSGKQSALYPVLRNLGAAGLLDSHVEPSMAGPPRRYYRITPQGREVLQAWTAAWRETRDSVDAVLAPVPPASTDKGSNP
ncbi:MAG: PadR family transcriptional regulator [Lysobacter spongiicola]|nr:PadR family transcriptional regulator [Lysobacter spongiicola]